MFVHFLALLFILYVLLYFENYSSFLEAIDTLPEDNLSLLEIISNNSNFMRDFILLFLFGASLFIYIWSFISGIIHLIVNGFVSVKDKFKRTREGNILAEKLYGMKNFIRDFSNLDEATKNHLVLWKDFLIYAVVLEENDVILSEISDIYHIDLINYKNYKD